jgi:tRNA dimethylallyltransferase
MFDHDDNCLRVQFNISVKHRRHFSYFCGSLDTNSQHTIIVVLGPTASGKTRLAARIAYALRSDVISGDSRQVFRGMDIGTGKDYEEYTVNGEQVPYHLINIAEAGEHYFVHRYMQDFFSVYVSVRTEGKVPVLCGGSGMYIQAVLSGFEYTAVPNDQALRAAIETKSREELLAIFHAIKPNAFTGKADTSSAKRLVRAIEISEYLNNHPFEAAEYPKLSPLIIGLMLPVETRRMKIEQRLITRVEDGLVEEVKQLLHTVPEEQLIRYGLEYKYAVMYIRGELSYDEFKHQLTIAIQQFAKRQMTYFRKMEKDGFHIHWIDASLPVEQQLGLSFELISKAFPEISLHNT